MYSHLLTLIAHNLAQKLSPSLPAAFRQYSASRVIYSSSNTGRLEQEDRGARLFAWLKNRTQIQAYTHAHTLTTKFYWPELGVCVLESKKMVPLGSLSQQCVCLRVSASFQIRPGNFEWIQAWPRLKLGQTRRSGRDRGV